MPLPAALAGPADALALVLPLAMPAYVLAYVYTDLLQYAGPVQSGLRAAFGWQRGDYWFPEIYGLGGAATVLAASFYVYVYLLARTAFLERAGGMLEVGRVLGLGPWGSFFRVSLPLARPAIAAGVSAYVVTILVTSFGWNFWLAIPCALALVVVLSLIVGTICFRFKLKEFYFAVVTMAFSEVLRLITLNWNSVTNGSLGITVVEKPSLWTPWGTLTFSSGFSWYYVTLALLVVVFIVCQPDANL